MKEEPEATKNDPVHSNAQPDEEGWITGPEAYSKLSSDQKLEKQPDMSALESPADTTGDPVDISDEADPPRKMDFRDKFLAKFKAEPEELIAQLREERPKEYVKAVFEAWRHTPPPEQPLQVGMWMPAPIGYTGPTLKPGDDKQEFVASQLGLKSVKTPLRIFNELLLKDFEQHGEAAIDKLREKYPVFFVRMANTLSQDPSTLQNFIYTEAYEQTGSVNRSGVYYKYSGWETVEDFKKAAIEQQRKLIAEAWEER